MVDNLTNQAPAFKDANDKIITSTSKSVAENMVAAAADDAAATNSVTTDDIDAPVTAVDPNSATDTLTYTLGGPDAALFRVRQDDPTTDNADEGGQLEVGAGTKLDYEKKKSYMVTVTATDPSLTSATIDVTINVTDVDENPEFAAPSEGNVAKTVKENTRTLTIYSFRATDPEGRKVYWSLSSDDTDSPDSDHFTISDRGGLSVNASPNYEDAEGLGSDRQFMVVVVASDDAEGAGITFEEEDLVGMSEKTVIVTVEDVEEAGTITISPKYPHVGTAVTAMLTDGDGDPAEVIWEWTVSRGDPAATATDESIYTPAAGDESKILRVKATYEEDGEGKTVGPVSAGTVPCDAVTG